MKVILTGLDKCGINQVTPVGDQSLDSHDIDISSRNQVLITSFRKGTPLEIS